MVTSTHSSLTNLLKRVYKNLTPSHRLQIFCVLILSVLASLLEIISIGALIPFLKVLASPDTFFEKYQNIYPFSRYSIANSYSLQFFVTALFIATVSISGLVRLSLVWCQAKLSHAIGGQISIDLYRKTLYQPYETHISRNSSEVISGITNKAKSIVGGVLFPAMTIFSSCVLLLTIFSTFIFFEPLIAGVTFLGFSFIYVSIVYSTKKKLLADAMQISHGYTNLIKVIQEGLGGIRDILINGTQEEYCRTYELIDRPLRKSLADVQIISLTPRYCIEIFGLILIAVIAFSFAKNTESFLEMLPIFAAMALGAQRTLPVLQQIYSSWTVIKSAQIMLEDTLHLIDQPLPKYSTPANSLIELNREICLKDVSYSYKLDSQLVLSKLNLVIPKGARVGIIGTTGGGKSTLLDIIMGLLSPTSGSLRVDDICITQENCRAWQANVSHVPQTIYLSDTTIAENIAFGIAINQIDFDRVKVAAQKACISDFIETLDKGYFTSVGERGVKLSGGQKQRIGIARALYRNSSVVILDEATSALDNETESKVMREISQIGREWTLILVAHRLSSLSFCDQIIKLDSGSGCIVGSYETLIRATS